MILAVLLAACVQDPPRPSPAETLARWTEAIELDLPAEILKDGAAVARAPDADPRLVALYARALHGAGETDEAIALLGRAQSAPLAIAAARIALDADDFAAVEARLAAPAGASAAVRFPDEPEAWLLLGRAHARRADLARAEPILARFVEIAPQHVEAPSAWFVLVDCARARGDAAAVNERLEARRRSAEWQAFHRARRIQAREHPGDPLPRLGLSQLWLHVGDFPRARAHLDAALALDAGFCRALELYGEVERRAGRLDTARARCEAAIACDGKLVDVLLTLARVERAAGRPEDAQRAYARYRGYGGTEEL